MNKLSAGILAYRGEGKDYEVFLVHPGGPFWSNKDLHAWSVPKGEPEEDEELFNSAVREFKEETGFDLSGNFVTLDPVKQPGGKIIYTWAVKADLNASKIKSNTIEIEWPPKSGKKLEIPEVDKAGWFSFEEARLKIMKGQISILEQLAEKLGVKDI